MIRPAWTGVSTRFDGPTQVVDMLNSLYTIYDTLEEAQIYRIYKVQTIGDAYMCAGGVPYSGDAAEDAIAVCKFAIKMIEVTLLTLTAQSFCVQISDLLWQAGRREGTVVMRYPPLPPPPLPTSSCMVPDNEGGC